MGHIYHICGYIAKSVLQKRSSLRNGIESDLTYPHTSLAEKLQIK